MQIARQDVIECPSTHKFTIQILELSKGLDIVDRYHDAKLACEVLKQEMEKALKR